MSTVFAQISSKWGIADLTNAGIPLIRGNYADAGLSAIGAIPGFSDAIKGGAKIAKAAPVKRGRKSAVKTTAPVKAAVKTAVKAPVKAVAKATAKVAKMPVAKDDVFIQISIPKSPRLQKAIANLDEEGAVLLLRALIRKADASDQAKALCDIIKSCLLS